MVEHYASPAHDSHQIKYERLDIIILDSVQLLMKFIHKSFLKKYELRSGSKNTLQFYPWT